MNKLNLIIFKSIKYLIPFLYPLDQRRERIIYKVNDKVKYELRVNTLDKFIVWEIWNLKEYTDRNFSIKTTDTIVDIGAQIGVFSVFAASQAEKGAVYAFEPNKENYRVLLKNRRLNGLQNLFVSKSAVTGKRGLHEFFLSKNISGGHSFFPTESSKTSSYKVSAITLEEIVNRTGAIDYLKIDTEGSEYEILLRTPPQVLSKIKKVVVEYHDYLNHEHNFFEIVDYLKKNRFKVKVEGSFFQRYIFKSGFIKAVRLGH